MNKGLLLFAWVLAAAAQRVEAPAGIIQDKIRGGLLGQILGDLNGLKHEMKYIAEPGNVEEYTPGLPEGAWTDDDTDVEWVYVLEMERTGATLLAPGRITELWKKHINSRIWCSNQYLRQLMDLGIEPPLTGQIQFNPWSDFNLSGQFLSETFGLIAPGMPQTAARIGLNYTRVGIDGEPAQATQLFTSMIATAFTEKDIGNLVTAGLAAVDPQSEVHGVVSDVLRWWGEQPEDWRATWSRIYEKYLRHGGTKRDFNGYELNTAAVVGSLLYGRGDFAETVRLAFNFGWDADCNAATAATIIGVIKGRRWIDAQGWRIVDRYQNRTRPGMPTDETLTGYAGRLEAIARMVILAQGGQEAGGAGRRIFRIRAERPANLEPLPVPLTRLETLRTRLRPEVERALTGTTQERARSAYLAMCLGEAERLSKERPNEWAAALQALNTFPKVIAQMFEVPPPAGAILRAQATAAGLRSPPSK